MARGLGRPKLKRQSEAIHITLTPAQKAAIRALAEQECMGLATWVRRCAMRAVRAEQERDQAS